VPVGGSSGEIDPAPDPGVPRPRWSVAECSAAAGPVLGAGIYLFLEQFVLASLADIHLAAFGALLIFIILMEPRGAAPRLAQLVGLVRRRIG